jgi:hypothetical protein
MYCSPIRKNSYEKHNTCFTKRQLIHIAKELKIPYSNRNKMELWKTINEQMSKYCAPKDEVCWIEKVPIIDTDKTHRPKPPTHYNNWLSNIDIMNVMKQYEDKYSSFKFIGVLPIDFNTKISSFPTKCISDELCNVDFKKFKQYQFGIVFNLDKHNEPGSHWVCVYLNTKKTHKNYGFYYFDSSGESIPKEIADVAKRTQDNLQDDSFKIHINENRKQYSDTECGMFCLYFIVKMVQGTTFNKLVNSKFTDKDMIRLRKQMFI